MSENEKPLLDFLEFVFPIARFSACWFASSPLSLSHYLSPFTT